MIQQNTREIPSVDRVLTALGPLPVSRRLATRLVREAVNELRESGQSLAHCGGLEAFVKCVRERVLSFSHSRIRPVINGTGVLIHTNLGRAPLSERAAAALGETARCYSALEFDLGEGGRGRRGAFLETALAELLEAEAATVVNNCAAALVLILRHFVSVSNAREVIISRGELVEIGGGFRVPDILETSGALLREVGTTNRTTVADYAAAIGPDTALLLRVHRSNFFMEGFVESAGMEELVALGAERGIPVVEDLGSGAVEATESFALLDHEPTVMEALRRGVDLVCCSGDKLFGGPQAGIIAGKAGSVATLKKEPFFRALRCDKLILAALQETVLAYLEARDKGGVPNLPLFAMMCTPVEVLRSRAERMLGDLADLEGMAEFRTGMGHSRLGGGTMPRSELESATLEVRPKACTAQGLARKLRLRDAPVIGYIEQDWWTFDLRTVFAHQDAEATRSLRETLSGPVSDS